MRAIGTIVTIVVVLGVVVLVVGLWQDWFEVSATSTDSGSSRDLDLSLKVNKDEIERDTGEAREKIQNFRQTAESAAALETVRGEITNIEVSVAAPETSPPPGAASVITVETEGGESLLIAVNEASVVRVNDEEAALSGLEVGENVVVVYREQEGDRIAQEVNVTRE